MAVGNPITELSTTGNFVPVTRTLTINGVSYDLSADRSWSIASPGGGSVTSVALTAPVGFSVSGSPVTSAGTLAISFAAGYSLPTTVKQSNWDDAYTFVSNFPSQTGNNGKFLYTSGSVLSWQPALQNPMTAVGDMIYGGVSGAVTVLTGNQSAVRQYLQQVGTGSASTAPVWGGIVSTDISGQAITRVNDTNVTLTLTGTPGNSVLNAVGLTLGWSGTLTAARGGTGTGGVTGIMLGNSTAPVTGITGIGGQILRANPSTGVYEFWTPTYLESPMTQLGQIIYSGAGGQPLALNANSTANNMYLRSVSSGTPSWASIQGGDIVGAAITTANDTNIQITASGNTGSALLRTLTLTAGWTGSLSVARGGTGTSTLTGVLIGNGTSAVTGVTGTASQLLRRNAANTAYEFFTHNFISNPMTTLGDIIYGNAAGAPLRLGANATSVNKFLRSVSSGTPSWEQITAADVSGLLSGSGTSGKLTKWTGSATLGDSIVTESASALDVSASVASTLKIANFRNTNASGFTSIGIDRSGAARYSFIEHSTAGTTDWYVGTAYNAGGGNTNYSIGTGINLSDAKFNVLTTGQIKLNAYTSSLSFSGIVAGYLAFTSGGSIITTAAPGGVSGTQNYLAKFDSTGLAVGNSRFVDDGTNFLLNGASSYVTGFNLIGDIAIQNTSSAALVMRRNAIPASGNEIAFIDAYAVTTGTTFTRSAGIDFVASQAWNSTSAGTDIAITTTPDNTIAPAEMFRFLNNGAVRFIGRTSNPLSPAAGTMYYNSSANQMRYYNGTTWISF
jgi:hypothetical protein